MDERFTVPRTADDATATIENSTITELHEKHKEMEQRMVDGSNLPASAYEQYRAEEKGGVRGASRRHQLFIKGTRTGTKCRAIGDRTDGWCH